MCEIIENVVVKNFGDILKFCEGIIQEDQIRRVAIDAIVATGAAFLCLPPKSIQQPGLTLSHTRKMLTNNGEVKRQLFAGAFISIQGRETQTSIMENDETTPALIGYLILEDLDLVIDTKIRKLIPNPAHDGKWVVDLF